jgi:hypothetical protein
MHVKLLGKSLDNWENQPSNPTPSGRDLQRKDMNFMHEWPSERAVRRLCEAVRSMSVHQELQQITTAIVLFIIIAKVKAKIGWKIELHGAPVYTIYVDKQVWVYQCI